MAKLRKATLVFLIKKSEGRITDICLAMKKRGFGKGRWNGVGGKVGDKQTETVAEAARREAKEEIGVDIIDFYKVAELTFYFVNNPAWDQDVRVYFSEKWDGAPVSSEEMSPRWFSIKEIPYEKMWPDDEFWLPEVLKGYLLKAIFKFGDNDVILEKEINRVDKL